MSAPEPSTSLTTEKTDSLLHGRYASIPFSSSTVTFAAILIAILVLGKTIIKPHDAREPPLIRARIPFIGHMFGLIRYGKQYVVKLNEKYHLPIYTMQSLHVKFYIVSSPQMVAQIHRIPKQLSFTPFLSLVAQRVSQFNADETAKIEKNMFRQDGPHGMIPEMHDMIIRELSPGAPNLQSMSAVVLRMMSDSINAVARQNEAAPGGRQVEKFYVWIRQCFVMASMTAFYGPDHPFAEDANLEHLFWDFEKSMNNFILNFAPRITAPKAWHARERLHVVLLDYFKRGGHTQASHMIQERYRIHRDHGLSVDACARAEIPMLQGVLANATTTSFWFLANTYAQPALLADLRAELARIVEVVDGEEEEGEVTTAAAATATVGAKSKTAKTKKYRISVETIKKQCPLMVGTYREVLRLLGALPTTRVVLEDTFLGPQKYLLKAGSVVQVATSVLHTSSEYWGDDTAEFKPYRYLTSAEMEVFEQRQQQQQPKIGQLYSFGGGVNLCPGRHFAQIEVLGLTAAVLWTLDISDARGDNGNENDDSNDVSNDDKDGSGSGSAAPPELPESNATEPPTAFSKPVKDVDVRVRWRGEEMGPRGRVEIVP